MKDESYRLRQCTAKAKHASLAAALVQLRKGKNNNRTINRGLKLSAYLCDFCGSYHVGNRPKGML